MDSLAIKLNTFSQIAQSIIAVSNSLYDKGLIEDRVSYDDVNRIFEDLDSEFINSWFEDMDTIRNSNSGKSVKVYSEFLKDIVLDMGFAISENDYDYVVYPDYFKSRVAEDVNLVEIPSHAVVSKNPFERIEARYSILEKLI